MSLNVYCLVTQHLLPCHSTFTALSLNVYCLAQQHDALSVAQRHIQRYSHPTLTPFTRINSASQSFNVFYFFRTGTVNTTHDSLSTHLLEYRPSSEFFHLAPESHYIRHMPQVSGTRRDTRRADPYILQRTFWRTFHCGDHTSSSCTGPGHKCEPASPLLCLATVADDPQRVERSEGKRPPSGSCMF